MPFDRFSFCFNLVSLSLFNCLKSDYLVTLPLNNLIQIMKSGVLIFNVYIYFC